MNIIQLFLSLFLVLAPSLLRAESMMAYPEVRTMHDSLQFNWLMRTKYNIPKDSTLQQIKAWAQEKKAQNEWHDYLFLENEIANIKWMQRQYDDGLKGLSLACKHFAQHKDTMTLEYAYSHYMFSHLYRGDRNKYIAAYECSIDIMKAIDHHSTLYTNCLFFLASSYYSAGYTDKAIATLKTLEGESAFNAITRINTDALVASLFAEMQPHYAIATMQQTIAQIDSINNTRYKAYKGAYTIRLGRYYGRIGDSEKERESYREAITIFKNSPDYINLAICYQNLAHSYIKEGAFQKALSDLAIADSIAKAHLNARMTYKTIELYGYLYEQEEQIDSALHYYHLAEEMIKAGQYGSLDRMADLNAGMAKLNSLKKNSEQALYHATKAINIYNQDKVIEPTDTPQWLAPIKASNIDLKIIKPLVLYTEYAAQCPKPDIAQYIYHSAHYLDTIFAQAMNYTIEDEVILGARAYALPSYNIALKLQVKKALETQDVHTAFAALSTADKLKSNILLFEKKCLQSNYLNHDSLDAHISGLEMQLSTANTIKDSSYINLKINNLRTEKFQKNMKLLLREEGEMVYTPPLTAALLQEIPAQCSLVEYHVADSILYTFIIDNEGINITTTALKNDLQKLTKQALRDIKTASGSSAALKALSDLLIAPIQTQLQQHILFIPDESFALFPLECLRLEEHYLVEKHSISYSYSINLWRDNKSKTKQKNYSALAIAPTFSTSETQLLAEYRKANADSSNAIFRGNDLEELPYSRREANNIYKLFRSKNLPCQKYIGTMATEANVRHKLNDYSILHLATHGVVSNNNESLTGLFLANVEQDITYKNNGFLSMKELFNMDITADLVVLSACKTAYGRVQRTEGVISLPRSFIYAGVPNIIASLWKVQDKHTAYLMERFYHHLLNNNMRYSEALQQAKIDCIQQGQLAMDWSSFILIGE